MDMNFKNTWNAYSFMFVECIIHVWLYIDLLSGMLRVLHLTVLEKMEHYSHVDCLNKVFNDFFLRNSFRVSNLVKEVPSRQEICFIYLKHDSGMSKLCEALSRLHQPLI